MKKSKHKQQLYLTYDDLKLLNDMLNYLDEFEKRNNEYPYEQSVYKEFPNKPIQKLEEEFISPFKIIEEKIPTNIEHSISIKEIQEKKVETITNIVKKLKKNKRDNDSINFIDLILSKLPDKKIQNVIEKLKKFFNTNDPKVIKYKLDKYYVIPDYSKTFLSQIIKSYYDRLKPSDYDNIQNTDYYKTLLKKYREEIPFITLEIHDPKSSYLKKFSLLFLIEINKIYDMEYLNRLIDSTINIKSKIKI